MNVDGIQYRRLEVWIGAYNAALPGAIAQGGSLDYAAKLARKHADAAVDQFNARFGYSHIKEVG